MKAASKKGDEDDVRPYDPADYGAACHLCPIFLAGNKNPVPPYEVPVEKRRLVMVGEAPGRKEQILKTPFVGASGRLLDRMFEDAGERRMRSFTTLTNAASCRSEFDKDNDVAAICCAPRLHHELSSVPENIPIVLAGKAAAKSVLNVRSILMTRGFVWTSKEIDEDVIKAAHKKAEKTKEPLDELKATLLDGRALLKGRVCFPVLHPAFILRSDTWKPILQIDIARVVRFLRGEFTVKDCPLVGSYEVVTTYAAAKKALKKLGPVIGMDIETEGVNPLKTPIRCVGIGDRKHIVIIAGASEDELESRPWNKKLFAPLVTEVLKRSTDVIFHNGMNFDVIALERDGVDFGDQS